MPTFRLCVRQLTSACLEKAGKERMYLLGKYLKLRYYQLLLNGDPRKIYIRSADSDRCLESAQALLAGLNPPKDKWVWSQQGELNNQWQPKAVHSAQAADDDLLSGESECLKLEDKDAWKNSTRYQQLLSEFRHDLQTLRANTGLEFEDDLEMLSNVEDALRTRNAFDPSAGVPLWYTSTLANRLAHISDVTAESRFSSAAVQRLYVGRLLYEIARNVNSKIRLLSLSAAEHAASNSGGAASRYKSTSERRTDVGSDELQAIEDAPLNVYQMQAKNKLRANPLTGPNMFIYVTSKHRMTALLNSLQIYSSQLHFGSLLLIELHHDPINQVHFLRLFTVSSQNANTFPEPLRVNPKACLDAAECYPQQFEQNIRHLMLDKNAWQEACSVLQEQPNSFDHTFKPQPLWPTAIDEPKGGSLVAPSTMAPLPPQLPASQAPALPTPMPATTTTKTTSTTTTAAPIDETSSTTTDKSAADKQDLEDTLIVGPLKDNQSSSSVASEQPAPATLPPGGELSNHSSTINNKGTTVGGQQRKLSPVDNVIIEHDYSDDYQTASDQIIN